jgi:hypothetical protein
MKTLVGYDAAHRNNRLPMAGALSSGAAHRTRSDAVSVQLHYVAEKRHTEHEQQVCLTMSKRRFVFNNPKDGLLKPGANHCTPLLRKM